MLPTHDQRLRAIETVRQILMVAPGEVHMERPLVRKLGEVLELDPHAIMEIEQAVHA